MAAGLGSKIPDTAGSCSSRGKRANLNSKSVAQASYSEFCCPKSFCPIPQFTHITNNHHLPPQNPVRRQNRLAGVITVDVAHDRLVVLVEISLRQIHARLCLHPAYKLRAALLCRGGQWTENFTEWRKRVSFPKMNTLETDVEIAADGSLKLLSPLPEWLKPGRAHVLLTVADAAMTRPKRQIPKATPEMIARRMAALEKVRELNPYRDIADPVEWQRTIREDVTQPGRD